MRRLIQCSRGGPARRHQHTGLRVICLLDITCNDDIKRFAARQQKYTYERLVPPNCRKRYEICMIKDSKKSQDSQSDLMCLAVYMCNEPLPEDIHIQRGVPLPADQKVSICACVAWEDLQV